MERLILNGKKVIITGASSGIGLCISELFVKEGAEVAMVARRKNVLTQETDRINGLGYEGKAYPIVGDVCDTKGIQRFFKEAVDTMDGLDVFINNAGIGGKELSIEATSDEFYDQLMQCNQRGTFMCCREAVNYFLPLGKGNIINIASVNSIRPVSGAAYGAAKFAIMGMTKNVALRLVGTGVRINALCPGSTITPMAEAIEDKGLFSYDPEYATVKTSGVLEVPNGRMVEIMRARTNRGVPCQPIEVANAALFMASDLSSAMQGQAVVIDNGGYL